MARTGDRGRTDPPAREIFPDELARRVAVIKEAKLYKFACCDKPSLEADELDIILSDPAGYHAEMGEKWRSVSIRPCVRCGSVGGKANPRKRETNRPLRISGRRFAVDGQLCKSCYDYLDWKQSQGEKRVGNYDGAKCPVDGIPWDEHTAACANHRLWPGAEPDPSLEHLARAEGKAQTTEAARRRRMSTLQMRQDRINRERAIGGKGAMAGQLIEGEKYANGSASQAEALDAILANGKGGGG
jgi:hypothetical protein